MKSSRIVAASLLALGCGWITGCGAEVPDGPPISSGQEEIGGRLFSEPAEIFVLVVDDALTPEAEELRLRAADSVKAGLENVRAVRWGSCGSMDPAAWHPGDLRVVVVRPSAPDAEALVTSVESPDLAWVTRTSLEEEITPVWSATKGALADRVAQPGEVYRPLHAAKRATDLIAGARPPETPAEEAFVAGLPEDRTVEILVASSRDDEDVAAVDQLVPAASARELLRSAAVMGPFPLEPSAGCGVYSPDGSVRLAEWGKAVDAFFGAAACEDPGFWGDLLAAYAVDCGPICRSRPLVIDDQGKAACRFFIDKADPADCDPERGWFDPDGEPTFVTMDGEELRRCEIRQLDGAALEACRATLECSGCGSGFCATEVPELDFSVACDAGEYWPLRFVGGALDAPGGWFTGVCQTGSASAP
jgi:hypothetical protein